MARLSCKKSHSFLGIGAARMVNFTRLCALLPDTVPRFVLPNFGGGMSKIIRHERANDSLRYMRGRTNAFDSCFSERHDRL